MNRATPSVLDGVDALVAKVGKMPDSARVFAISEAAAEADYRIGPELQEALLRAGLPCRQLGESRQFDSTDLLNTSLQLGLGSRQRKVLAWWARELERPYGEVHSYRLDYRAGCPSPGHRSACEFSLLRPGPKRLRVVRDQSAGTTLHSELFTLARTWPELPDRLLDLLHSLSTVSFLRLPEPLRWDTEFIRHRNVGDCSGFGRLLVEEGRARGLTARFCYGRSLTPPFSAPHYWAEFLVDDVWVPVDPILIDALTSWGVLDAKRWDRTASMGAIMGRLANRFRPIVLHNGRPLQSTLPVYHAED
jgi:hypothetical protein